MRQGTGQVLAKAGAGLAGKRAGLFQLAVEVVRVVRQPQGFELGRVPRSVLAHQYEVARVRHQHQPVTLPVAAHLSGVRGEPGVVADGLHLDHAALRRLPGTRLALLYLPR